MQEPKAARLSLGLIREALAQPPGAQHRVLKEVLDLTSEQPGDPAHPLERTTLASIIYTNKLVTDHLEFLVDIASMLFGAEKKKCLLERSQLHRIISSGKTWIFGEEHELTVDDQGLTKML